MKIQKNKAIKKEVKATTRRRMSVTRANAKATQDLGNGFRRWVFERTIAPNQFFFLTFNAGNLKIVSNGFWISGNLSLTAYPTSFYSQTENIGITVIRNPTNFTRTVQFFFITKQ